MKMEDEKIKKLLRYRYNKYAERGELPRFIVDGWKFFHRDSVQEAYLVEEHREHIPSTMAEYLLFSEEPELGLGGEGELRTRSGEVVIRGYGPRCWGDEIAYAIASNRGDSVKKSNHPGCGGTVYHLYVDHEFLKRCPCPPGGWEWEK